MTPLQPFNVFATTQGVYPPTPRATVALPPKSDSYYLMTNAEHGPQQIPFWHTNDHPEVVVTLEGSYDITVDGQRLTQTKGDVLHLPAGSRHGDVFTQSGYRNLQIENTHQGCQSPPNPSI